LGELTYTHGDSLQPAATALHLQIKQTGFFTRKPTSDGITSNTKVINTAFSPATLEQGYNSDVIELNSENLLVLRLKQHLPATVKPFASVRQEIMKAVSALQIEAHNQAIATAIIAAIKAGKSLDAISKQFSLKLNDAKNQTRYSSNVNPIIIKTAFNLPRPSSVSGPSVSVVPLTNGSFALVMVNQVLLGNSATMSEEERNAFAQQLSQSYGQLDYKLYADQIIKHSKVKVSD